MTETIAHKILTAEGISHDIPNFMDNWNMSGVVRPSKSTAGRGKPIFDTRHRMIITPTLWQEDVFLRSFAKALVFAASNGKGRLQNVSHENIDRFLTTSLPTVGPRTIIMHPDELDAQKDSGHFRLNCYTLRYLPKKTVLAVGPPEFVGYIGFSTKGVKPKMILADYFINPMYVTGCRRTGRIPTK